MRDETLELDEWWRPGSYPMEELVRALLAGGVAGPVTSHDRLNVRWKVGNLVRGDEESQFGLTGLGGHSEAAVLAMIGAEAGFDPDPELRLHPVPIDPLMVLAACRAAGRRLAEGAERGERMITATGHPRGLNLLYAAVGSLFEEHGGKLLQPADGARWRDRGRPRQLRFGSGVGLVLDGEAPIHTHRPEAMTRMLDEVTPDLVLADHGLAGAAIEAGIDTIAVADINDPALVVAKHLGRTSHVLVMDDNVRPESYWPCFQAIAAQFA